MSKTRKVIDIECPVCNHMNIDYPDEVTQCTKCGVLIIARYVVDVLDDDTTINVAEDVSI